MSNDKNSKQDTDIAVLKVKLNNLDERFQRFINNDFRHLEADVKALKARLTWGLLWGIFTLVITQIILKLFL